jgi:hypothetical protein
MSNMVWSSIFLQKKKSTQKLNANLALRNTDDDDIHTHDESSSLLATGRTAVRVTEQQTKIVKAVLYAVQVFYSFFIM